jgi:DNA-binding XRE family transcriptional regulator
MAINKSKRKVFYRSKAVKGVFPMPGKYSALRMEMQNKHVSQNELADVLKISKSTISKKFRGINDWTLTEMYSVLKHLRFSYPGMVLGHYFPEGGHDEPKFL